MPRARQITLSATDRRKLKALAYSHTAGYQQVIRARIVRDAAHGYSNARIAGRQGVHKQDGQSGMRNSVLSH